MSSSSLTVALTRAPASIMKSRPQVIHGPAPHEFKSKTDIHAPEPYEFKGEMDKACSDRSERERLPAVQIGPRAAAYEFIGAIAI